MSYTNNIRNIFSIKFFNFALEKIDRATLLELARAFAVLAKNAKRFLVEPSMRFGGRLVDYLLEIEREEKLVTQHKRHR